MEQYRYSIISVVIDTKNHYNIELESGDYLRVKKKFLVTEFGRPLNIPETEDIIELYISCITSIKKKSISGLVYFIIDHELKYTRETLNPCPGFTVMWLDCSLDEEKKTNLIETVQAINYGLIADKLFMLNPMLSNPTKDWFEFYKDNIFKLFYNR